MKGTVTRFIDSRGIGWIRPNVRDHRDVFFRASVIVGDEPYKTIEAGTVVEFEMVYGDHRGPRATFVQRLDEKEATHVGHGE